MSICQLLLTAVGSSNFLLFSFYQSITVKRLSSQCFAGVLLLQDNIIYVFKSLITVYVFDFLHQQFLVLSFCRVFAFF